MRLLVAAALVATSAPAFAVASTSADQAGPPRERRTCTRIDRRAGSRVSQQRICLTATEWRQRLGADWRQNLAGLHPVEEDLELLETRVQRVEAPALMPNP